MPFERRKKLLNSMWSCGCKRHPDGSLLKHKCRTCADGSRQQHGIYHWDTYSPVVQWNSVRQMLILSSMLGLASRQVDFVQAFPQAPLEDDVHMRIPPGFAHDPNTNQLRQTADPKFKDFQHCIKLKRNLCGCKQASRNWFLFLTEGLKKDGFVPSESDPCLFLRHDAVMCLHTDDCCIFALDSATIDNLLKSPSTEFILKDEGSTEDFLGVNISKKACKHGQEIHLQQSGLIQVHQAMRRAHQAPND